MNIQHPWQSGPTELIYYAINHLHRTSEFDQRIAFLLLDIGIETLFKTFLQLPDEVSGTNLSYTERKKASEGSFHELVRGIQKAAGSRLDDIDLTHIQFYHDLRNKLYHQGNGITIPTEKAGLIVLNSVVILKEVQFSKTEPPIVKDTSLSFISTHKLCFCLRSNTLLSYHQWSCQTPQVVIL